MRVATCMERRSFSASARARTRERNTSRFVKRTSEIQAREGTRQEREREIEWYRIKGRGRSKEMALEGSRCVGSRPSHSANNAPYRLHNEREYRYMHVRPLAVLVIMSTQIMHGEFRA